MTPNSVHWEDRFGSWAVISTARSIALALKDDVGSAALYVQRQLNLNNLLAGEACRVISGFTGLPMRRR